MKKSLVENESEEVAQNENNNNMEFEDTKKKVNIHKNDLSKMVVRPSEELMFNKNRHGLGYD
jgi:hypothetical protein